MGFPIPKKTITRPHGRGLLKDVKIKGRTIYGYIDTEDDDDFGQYICEASNFLGVRKHSILVNEAGKLLVRCVNYRWHQVEWIQYLEIHVEICALQTSFLYANGTKLKVVFEQFIKHHFCRLIYHNRLSRAPNAFWGYDGCYIEPHKSAQSNEEWVDS